MILKKIKNKYICLKKCFEKQNIKQEFPDIIENEFWEIYKLCKPYTMTSVERLYSLYQSVNYILANQIEGDFVECGVWRGGSSMFIAKLLEKRGIYKKIFLFDTFEGMSEPTEFDLNHSGSDAKKLLDDSISDKENSVWCLANEIDVYNNLKLTGYDLNYVHLIKGKVEDTIPNSKLNDKIALLRLDTDWYESTKHELTHLYPLLNEKAVLIIDDYGHWQGCRKAVDEYFLENNISKLLHRIDYTGRILFK